jgi:hypothetical protein
VRVVRSLEPILLKECRYEWMEYHGKAEAGEETPSCDLSASQAIQLWPQTTHSEHRVSQGTLWWHRGPEVATM